MTDSIAIEPVGRPITGSVRPPGSKSITNRALICASLASGSSTISGALDSEDTRVMIAALQDLQFAIDVRDEGRQIVVDGGGGNVQATRADLFVANSGTTMRFLAALATLGHGEFRIHGVQRMHQRPIGDLAQALSDLGGQVRCLGENDCPPIVIQANGLPGGTTSIKGDISSQFLSGLLMAAPCCQHDVTIDVEGDLVSVPYVEMTLRVMQQFGIDVGASEQRNRFQVAGSRAYAARSYDVEPDASAASYFFAVAAITGGEVSVDGLNRDSLQGDIQFCQCLAKMGCEVTYGQGRITVRGKRLQGIDVDMNSISDTAQTLAVVALFAEGPTRIRNVAHIRHKETDRITAVANELQKLGAVVDQHDDGLTIHAAAEGLHGGKIETYQDHRMAMSFALAGLTIPEVVVLNPSCTDKTYPGFFSDLQQLIGKT